MPSDRSVATAEALWRAASNAPLGGDDKFPESILMLVEVLNGPRGGFTIMEFNFTIHANGKTTIQITDNGQGMCEEDNGRLLTWASESDAIGHSKYGNGLKMFLAKLGDYLMEWSIETRVADFPEGIYKYSGPWKGDGTKRQTLSSRLYADFPQTGFRITAVCDTTRLFKIGEQANGQTLLEQIKELVCTRKAQSVLNAVDFRFKIADERDAVTRGAAPTLVVCSSLIAGWCSLQQTLANLAAPVDSADYKGVTEIFNHTYELVSGKSVLEKTVYCCALPVIPEFPLYGKRTGEKLLRNHIFLGDTMIEAPDPRSLTGKGRVPRPHFVTFDICRAIDPSNPAHLAALPTPATAKVSLRRECLVVQRVIDIIKEEESNINALMTHMHVGRLEARIREAAMGIPAPAGAGAVAGAGVEHLLPAAPVWTPIAINDITMESLGRLIKENLERNCAFYGIPKADKKAENIDLLFALTLSGEKVLSPLQDLDLDDEENTLSRCLLHAAIMKSRRF